MNVNLAALTHALLDLDPTAAAVLWLSYMTPFSCCFLRLMCLTIDDVEREADKLDREGQP